jgi:indole-3-glycerol phosphate synthase
MAEIKRASPSKGAIAPTLIAETVIPQVGLRRMLCSEEK